MIPAWLHRVLVGRKRLDEWRALARAESDARNARRCPGKCATCDYLDTLCRISADDKLHRDAAEVRDQHRSA